MGRYSVRCPICSANIELSPSEQAALTNCPACKARIREKIDKLEGREGMTTVTANGPNLHPVNDLIQDVY